MIESCQTPSFETTTTNEEAEEWPDQWKNTIGLKDLKVGICKTDMSKNYTNPLNPH